jgi:hypothetical protein
LRQHIKNKIKIEIFKKIIFKKLCYFAKTTIFVNYFMIYYTNYPKNKN